MSNMWQKGTFCYRFRLIPMSQFIFFSISLSIDCTHCKSTEAWKGHINIFFFSIVCNLFLLFSVQQLFSINSGARSHVNINCLAREKEKSVDDPLTVCHNENVVFFPYRSIVLTKWLPMLTQSCPTPSYPVPTTQHM